MRPNRRRHAGIPASTCAVLQDLAYDVVHVEGTRAALLSIPPELYDAAEVDGAGIWRKVWNVTLPQLRGILLIMLILQVIATAQVFLEPFLFTGGGPARATKTILLYIYVKAFRNSLGGDYGEATAVSVLLAIVLAVLSWLSFKLTDRWSTS